ncbi:MAG: hypothetical protein AAB804_01625 [Patescibacteria group bacterium]
MKELIEAAAAAAKELRKKPLPEELPATRTLALVTGDSIHRKGLHDFDFAFWRSVLEKAVVGDGREADTTCEADVFFLASRFSHRAMTLATARTNDAGASGLQHVPESERVDMILRICDAMIEVGET